MHKTASLRIAEEADTAAMRSTSRAHRAVEEDDAVRVHGHHLSAGYKGYERASTNHMESHSRPFAHTPERVRYIS